MSPRAWILAALLAGTARAPAAQSTAGASATATTGAVTGTVRDSVSRAPIEGAVVQLTSIAPSAHLTRAVRTDSAGRYRVAELPAGRYALGFLHPRLDSLGVQASVREVRVRAGRETRADLTTPSAALLRATYCGSGRARGTLVIGVVRRASDRTPVAGAEVVGEWLEFVVRQGGVERQQPALYARTGDDGGYALCDVPAAGSVFVSANAGADTTDRIELVADATGVLRRDLYVAPVRRAAPTVAPAIAGSDPTVAAVRAAPRPRRTGDAILRGTVRTADGDAPLAGAIVRLVDGPTTRADARGEWTLAGVPDGTRVIEVRALGYYPVSRSVDVLAGGAPVAIALATFQSVLDTVRVLGARGGDRSGGEFARRARTLGAGTFLDSAQLRVRGGTTTSELFRSMNGLRLEGAGLTRTFMMRGSFGECVPSVYVDGLYMAQPMADELDRIAPRDAIVGVEVYNDATAPPQFQRALDGCGVIVIWTRPPAARARRR